MYMHKFKLIKNLNTYIFKLFKSQTTFAQGQTTNKENVPSFDSIIFSNCFNAFSAQRDLPNPGNNGYRNNNDASPMNRPTNGMIQIYKQSHKGKHIPSIDLTSFDSISFDLL